MKDHTGVKPNSLEWMGVLECLSRKLDSCLKRIEHYIILCLLDATKVHIVMKWKSFSPFLFFSRTPIAYKVIMEYRISVMEQARSSRRRPLFTNWTTSRRTHPRRNYGGRSPDLPDKRALMTWTKLVFTPSSWRRTFVIISSTRICGW